MFHCKFAKYVSYLRGWLKILHFRLFTFIVLIYGGFILRVRIVMLIRYLLFLALLIPTLSVSDHGDVLFLNSFTKKFRRL